MKLLIFLLYVFSVATYANKSRPGYERNSAIIKNLLKQEKAIRENRTVESVFDIKTKDYLKRKTINMKISVDQFRSYIFKYKNDSSIRDYLSIMSLFTISSSENRNVKERKVVEELLGLVVRHDSKEGEKFLIKPRDLLSTVEEWSMTELFELRNLLKESIELSENGTSEVDSFLTKIGTNKSLIENACK